jgi:hypothetical protein
MGMETNFIRKLCDLTGWYNNFVLECFLFEVISYPNNGSHLSHEFATWLHRCCCLHRCWYASGCTSMPTRRAITDLAVRNKLGGEARSRPAPCVVGARRELGGEPRGGWTGSCRVSGGLEIALARLEQLRSMAWSASSARQSSQHRT